VKSVAPINVGLNPEVSMEKEPEAIRDKVGAGLGSIACHVVVQEHVCRCCALARASDVHDVVKQCDVRHLDLTGRCARLELEIKERTDAVQVGYQKARSCVRGRVAGPQVEADFPAALPPKKKTPRVAALVWRRRLELEEAKVS